MTDPDPITRLNAALEGRYRIERELGEGGMATVYLADDIKHERKVALKVLKPELAAVVGAERFLAEIKTTANLQHPNILPLHDSGEADGFLFYVMPYVEGETLRDRLEREHQLPVDDAVQIAKNVAEALDYAHRHGVIHRDIKPANILLQDGKPVISDFGIALAISAGGGHRLTETGLSIGTPLYMSPEQATGDQHVGTTTDIYALGCVLYEMLIGEPPFTGGTPQAILGKIIAGEVASATKQRASVPANLDAVLRKSLEKLPADRFSSSSDFARALGDASYRHRTQAAEGAGASPGRWGAAAIWAVAGASAMAVFWPLVFQANELTQRQPVRFTLTALEAQDVRYGQDHFAFSPDGRQIVFHGVSRGVSRLYRRLLGGLEIFPVPGTEGAAGSIAFSPDGRLIAFWTPAGVVESVPIEGGAARTLGDANTEPVGMSWGVDSGLVMGMLALNTFTGLSRFSSDGDSVQRITNPPTNPDASIAMDHDPHVLGGGGHVLFVHSPGSGGGETQLGLVSLRDGSTELFDLQGSAPHPTRSIVGLADGVLLYIDASGTLMAVAWAEESLRPTGTPVRVPGVPEGMQDAKMASTGTMVMLVGTESYDIMIVDDRGNIEETIPRESVGALYPRFSPDGRRAALGGLEELWTYEVGVGRLRQISLGLPTGLVAWTSDSRRVLGAFGTSTRDFGSVSETILPDGSGRLGFARTGRIWWRAADMSDDVSLRHELKGRHIAAFDISPDGRVLVFAEYTGVLDGPLQDISTVRLDDENAAILPFVHDPASEGAPRWHPSGEWIAYASNVTGPHEVFVRPFPGPGPVVQVSDGGGGQPVWSSDGLRLFYRTEAAIMAANLTVDSSTGELDMSSLGDDTERLFGGEFFGSPELPTATYDVHPDGRRFLLARQSVGSGVEIVVWMDWIHEMKEQLVPN